MSVLSLFFLLLWPAAVLNSKHPVKRKALHKPSADSLLPVLHLVLHPAPEDSGIVFRRVDLNPPVDIPAAPMNVNDTRMATTVNVGRAAVATIEHLMSAFSGLGVDNCLVEVNAPEIPVMDGSGAAFVYLIHSAGLVEQKAPRRLMAPMSSAA